MKKIIPNELLGDDTLVPIFRTYNLDQLVVADVPGQEHKMVICAEAEVDGTHYIDSRTQKVVEFNHLTQECGEVGDDAPDAGATMGPFRAALEAEVAAYVSKQYGKGRAAHSVVARGDAVHVVIAGLNTNLRNYWSGNWRSSWTVTLNGGSATVGGSIKALVHYFEDGNVQMESDRTVAPSNVSYDDPASLASAALGVIVAGESSAQNGLEQLYSNMTDETFKDMRRVLPVTRTKFDWSGASSRLAASAGKK